MNVSTQMWARDCTDIDVWMGEVRDAVVELAPDPSVAAIFFGMVSVSDRIEHCHDPGSGRTQVIFLWRGGSYSWDSDNGWVSLSPVVRAFELLATEPDRIQEAYDRGYDLGSDEAEDDCERCA